MTFGVNVLAHYLLVRQLLHRFVAPAWIVLTTSDTHFGEFRYTLGVTPPPRWEASERLAAPRASGMQGGSRAYATSKLATIYLSSPYAGPPTAGGGQRLLLQPGARCGHGAVSAGSATFEDLAERFLPAPARPRPRYDTTAGWRPAGGGAPGRDARAVRFLPRPRTAGPFIAGILR
jgi:NAD(P)-dependent dehydrogenase (short-subunit alcohol dehydrogenase family)